MHELTLCRNVVNIAIQNMPSNKIVKKINLEVGKLLAVDPSALLFSFALVAKNTPLAEAVLNIIEIEGRAHCNNCDCHFTLMQRYEGCSQCESHLLTIVSGEELRIKSMEVKSCAEFADVTVK